MLEATYGWYWARRRAAGVDYGTATTVAGADVAGRPLVTAGL